MKVICPVTLRLTDVSGCPARWQKFSSPTSMLGTPVAIVD